MQLASLQMAALGAAAVLAVVHLLAGHLRFLAGTPRSVWLSAAGGVSVAYVFLHLLPELASGQDEVEPGGAGVVGFLEHHVYIVALLGLALFYGVDRYSLASRRSRHRELGEDKTGAGAFWLSTASFAVYNVVVGYVLVREETETATSLVLFATALGVHFVINDFGLREHHKEDYDHVARWVFAAAVLAGWMIGSLTEVPGAALALIIAVLAGGFILNVFKEELPGERQARFVPFVAGLVAYSALLQAAA